MDFTSEEMVILMCALDRYADFMDDHADTERGYETGGNPQRWEARAESARNLLKRIEDRPVLGTASGSSEPKKETT